MFQLPDSSIDVYRIPQCCQVFPISSLSSSAVSLQPSHHHFYQCGGRFHQRHFNGLYFRYAHRRYSPCVGHRFPILCLYSHILFHLRHSKDDHRCIRSNGSTLKLACGCRFSDPAELLKRLL